MDKRFKKHFVLKKRHTEIKHALFSSALEKSLSIASALDDFYSYLDLFAGVGIFEDDGSIGSPIIALEMFRYHYNNCKESHKIEQFWIHLCEKNGYNELKKNLKKAGFTELSYIKGYIRKNWEEEIETIQKIINKAKYGFIFADQFSTELDLRKFLPFLEGNSYEVLVFFNQNTLSRQKGRLHPNDVKRIAKVLAIEEDEVLTVPQEKFKDFVISTLKSHFFKYRQYVSIAAIPITVQRKLRDADFFYLLFATGHPLILDSFLETYSENVLDRRAEIDPSVHYAGSLFKRSPTEDLEDLISTYIVKKREVSLNELYLYFTQEFLSWRAYVHTDATVPTLRNITYALRELEKKRLIEVRAPQRLLYKRGPKRNKKTLGQKGQVNPAYLKRYSDLDEVMIYLRPR